MITISDEAAEKGKAILALEGKTGWGLRIFVAGSSCCGPSFGMDVSETAAAGDAVIEKNGFKLFVDETALEKLDGTEVHYMENGENSGFVVKGNQPPHSCSHGQCS